MLALDEVEAETDPTSGLPISVVTDPANQFRFVTRIPTTNWAARTLAIDKKKYADGLPKDTPLDGLMWSVYLQEPDEE